MTAQRRALEVPPPTAPRVHWPLWLAGVGTVGLVACAVVAWPLGAGPGALVFALVLGLLGLAASFRDETQTRHEQRAYDRARQYEGEQRELRRLEASQLEGDRAQTRAELAQALAVGGAATESDVAHRIAEVRSALDDQQRRARLASQLAEAERESDRARHAVGELEHERARADATLDLIQTEVDERLAQLGVTASLSAEAALDVLTDLSRIQERALALEAERVGLGADTARVERAARALREQAAATGLGADQDPASLASLLNDWLSADAEERGQLATLQARHEASVGPLAQQRAALAQCTQEINAVLAAAKVDSVEAFRQKTAAAQAWAAAETDRQQALASLAVLGVDPQQARPQLTDVAGLFDTLARANQALTALKAQREHQREALGRLRAKLEHVERDDEAAVLRAQEEALVAQLGPAVDRHVVSSLARAILEHARERFDADQQHPRRSARGGPVRSADLAAVPPRSPRAGDEVDGSRRPGRSAGRSSSSLGTRELLLLAFRLAVVEDFGEVRLALPVLLDDVTVNLDAERAERVIEVLAGLSKRHQVLAFTCHAPVRALFREAGARVHEVAQRTQLSLLPALGDAGGQT